MEQKFPLNVLREVLIRHNISEIISFPANQIYDKIFKMSTQVFATEYIGF